METSRLEAFSDGVIAVIITVLVLEMKVPHGPDLEALAPVLPVFLSYVLSFVYVGIYWNNHHHMNDSQRKSYEETLECDFSFEIQGSTNASAIAAA